MARRFFCQDVFPADQIMTKMERKNEKGNAVKAFPFLTNYLERELQSELDESRVIDCACYLAEAAVAQACVRWPKLGAVEDVEKF
jgi:hypothetical protein